MEVLEKNRTVPMTVADASAIFDTYGRCVQQEDIQGWIALWAEDPVVKLAPGTPTLFGREAIAGHLRADLDVISWQKVDITVGEVVSVGDLAFARGTVTLAGETKAGGDPVAADGKFLTVFGRQADGSWKICRDVYNFDS